MATITVTVTATSPLTVQADGADTTNPADKAVGTSPAIGERWICELRTPNKPLLTSEETAAP